MADDKKKPAAAAPSRTTKEEIIFLLAGLLLLAVILNQIVSYLSSLGFGDISSDWSALLEVLRPYWSIWKVIAAAVSAACVVWAIYSNKKLKEINEAERKLFNLLPDESLLEELTEEAPKEKENEKWLRVVQHMNSENPSDWRLAIIEADVMLEELLRTLGYQGDSVGEMLKSVDKSDFLTLEAAWEAHKIRNSIAHAAGDFQLNERETRRATSLFETVFREFDLI